MRSSQTTAPSGGARDFVRCTKMELIVRKSSHGQLPKFQVKCSVDRAAGVQSEEPVVNNISPSGGSR